MSKFDDDSRVHSRQRAGSNQVRTRRSTQWAAPHARCMLRLVRRARIDHGSRQDHVFRSLFAVSGPDVLKEFYDVLKLSKCGVSLSSTLVRGHFHARCCAIQSM